MEKEILNKIIDAANQAPSGGNSQPWKFLVENNLIKVITLPKKDHKVLNFKNRGTYIAHGALIENIDIAAKFFGYKANIQLFPEENVSAKINFLHQQKETELYNFIFSRHSNRKSYNGAPLNKEEKGYLFQDLVKFPQCAVSYAESENIRPIAENLAFDTIINFKNKLLHKLLFDEIIWKEEEQKNRSGLYVKTMEVQPPKSVVFNLLKNWKLVQFFNKINFFKKIYTENVKTVSSSSIVIAIGVNNNDLDFLNAGRLMQNIWLRATKLGLSGHLVTGIAFFWQQANFGQKEIFSESEHALINSAYKNLSERFKMGDKIIALTLRIGKAAEPLAISYKRPPEIEWMN